MIMRKPKPDLCDLAPALVWRTDSAASFEYFNRNWLDFTGRSLQQEINTGWTEGIHTADRDIFFRDFMTAIRAKLPVETVFRLRRHDGEYRWIQNIGSPLWDEEGNFAGYIGYCFDRTEQHETEEILRKLSRAVEQGTSSIVITDTEGCIEYVNSSYTRMSGYKLEELIGRNPIRESDGMSLPDVFGDAWESLKNGREWRGELQTRKKGGESYWEFATFSPIANAEDVVTHYLAVKEDITARKHAERELAKSRAELLVKHEELQHAYLQVARSQKEWENTMDCIGDILILVDPRGMILRCNKAMKEFTGAGYKEMKGANWKDLLSRHGINLPENISSGVEVLHESSGRWLFCRLYPFTTDHTGAVSGTVITLHDFTERKKVTCELENAYSVLKATQAKVVQQEKMATIGQLASGVAHEINNPMGFISSNLGTLRKYLQRLTEFVHTQTKIIETIDDADLMRELEEKRKGLKIEYVLKDGIDLIEESLEGAERVRSIVQNLKGFARIDEAERKAVIINECIESTIKIVWNELKYKAKVTLDLGEIPMTRCFPQQLNQVFLNLVVNAGQAIETEGEIVIKTWHDEASIFISFADNGSGIPPEVIEHIFEPFFTTKEVGKGTGLGLSITYDIIKNHGGEIVVDSEPGKGTCFTVRLPVV